MKKLLNKKTIIIFIVVIVLILGGLFGVKYSKKKPQITNSIKTIETKENIKKKIAVITNASALTNYRKALKSISNKEYKLSESLGQDKIFCNKLLNNFKSNNNIKLIEPIVKTDNYNNKKLKPYFEKCPQIKKKLNLYLEYNGITYVQTKNLPEEERVKFGHVFNSGYGYKLYDIDFDNNPKNGKQILFYSGGFYSNKLKHDTYDEYYIVDFNKCQTLGGANVGILLNYETKEPTGNYNGVINYNNKYFIYSTEKFKVTDKKAMSINFKNWNFKTLGNVDQICSFF